MLTGVPVAAEVAGVAEVAGAAELLEVLGEEELEPELLELLEQAAANSAVLARTAPHSNLRLVDTIVSLLDALGSLE
jgi:hypothetical protein